MACSCPTARVILSRMLEQHGLAVDTAESAEQALEYLRQQRPDVIFMDHLMPGMNGADVLRQLKSDPQLASIPVLMLTAVSSREDLVATQPLPHPLQLASQIPDRYQGAQR